MRKIFILLLLCSSIACKKDPLFSGGNYVLESLVTKDCEDENSNSNTDFSEDGCHLMFVCREGHLIFNDDGSFLNTTAITQPSGDTITAYQETGTYLVNENILTLCNENFCSDYEIKGNRIIRRFNSFNSTCVYERTYVKE